MMLRVPQISKAIAKFGRFSALRQASTSVNVEDKKQSLEITEACAKRLHKVAEKDEFLRISIEGGGCSGFSYKFDLDKVKTEEDLTFARDGVEVVTDKESFELIKGSTVDYTEELIKSAFYIAKNPQAESGCSCGVSFSIDI